MDSDSQIKSRVKSGAETIDLQEGNSHGILLLHGFGDTPQTLSLLAHHLNRAGYDVKAPLLPGHGRSVEAFVKSERRDWLACARDELSKMRAAHRRISVGGLSMGGSLAAILAAEAKDMSALVLIAPYLDMPSSHKIASALHWLWGPLAGVRKSNSPRSILNPEERAKNLGYGVYSGALIYELWRLGVQARRALPSITTPTLVLQSKADPRIRPETAERAFAALGSKEKRLVWAEGGGHIITVDYGREEVFAEVTRWIKLHDQ